MKKILLICAVVFGSYACTKDVKSCWECKGSLQADSSYKDFGCEMTKAEVDKYNSGVELTDFAGNSLGHMECRRK